MAKKDYKLMMVVEMHFDVVVSNCKNKREAYRKAKEKALKKKVKKSDIARCDIIDERPS